MRIVVIGSTGTIGRAVVSHLASRHDVIQVAHSRGDYRVDLESAESIQALFGRIGSVDAGVSCAGEAKFKPLEQLTDEDFAISLHKIDGTDQSREVWTARCAGQRIVHIDERHISASADAGECGHQPGQCWN